MWRSRRSRRPAVGWVMRRPRPSSLARPGRSEVEVAGDLNALLRRVGFERPAFETIVASGPNSALPHARPGSRVLQEGDGVVLDFGGVYDGYCVDSTRTVQLGDAGTDFRRLFAAVAEAQQAAIAMVKPGVKASTIDAAARSALARHATGGSLRAWHRARARPRSARGAENRAATRRTAGPGASARDGVHYRAGRLCRRRRRRAHRRRCARDR